MSICKHCCLNLCFPPLCLSCHEERSLNFSLLCHNCWGEIQFSTPALHCKRCFNPYDNEELHFCSRCKKTPSPFNRILGVLNPSQPTQVLSYFLKQSNENTLQSGVAALMAYRYLFLQKPLPHVIVANPHCSASYILAKDIATIFNRPLLSSFQKNWLSQKILFKKNESLEDCHILLISEKLDHQFFLTGKDLLKNYPAYLEGLTLTHFHD